MDFKDFEVIETFVSESKQGQAFDFKGMIEQSDRVITRFDSLPTDTLKKLLCVINAGIEDAKNLNILLAFTAILITFLLGFIRDLFENIFVVKIVYSLISFSVIILFLKNKTTLYLKRIRLFNYYKGYIR